MNKYTFNFEYSVPEFADLIVETPDKGYVQPINEIKEIAMKEFMEMNPEAIDPVIVSWSQNAS